MLRARGLKLGIQIILSATKLSRKIRDCLMTVHVTEVAQPRFNRFADNRKVGAFMRSACALYCTIA